MSEVTLNDMTLPSNWQLVKLGAVCKTTSGGTPSRKNPAYYEGDIPWVKSGELPDGPVMEIEESVSDDAIKNSSAKVFPNGSLLVAMYGATVGKLGILNRDAATNQAVCAIFPSEDLDNKYLFWYLRAVRSDLISQAVGGAQPNINQGILREVSVPLAPLEQQKRIVAEIERQFSRLDEAVANLKRVKANLKRYKAAVLKAAVEGKLTEEWRKQHPDVESADKLLERILEERREKWEETELTKMEAKGKTPKNDKWKARYKDIALPKIASLPKIPNGWCWLTVDHFTFVTKLAGFEYTKFVKYDSDGDLAVIKAENAGKDGFKKTKFSKVKSETVAHLTRSMVNAGDLLMVFVGAGTGQVARVPDDQPYFLGPNIGMIRIESGRVLPAYLEHYLRSPVGNQLALGFAKAVAQPSLSMGSIRMIPVPIPPLGEQALIVDKLEEFQSKIDALDFTEGCNSLRAVHLRQSILKKAFSGRLI